VSQKSTSDSVTKFPDNRERKKESVWNIYLGKTQLQRKRQQKATGTSFLIL
jgi:hypothetical protein